MFEHVLESEWYTILSGFVAINTAMYVTLAIFKSLPKIYIRDFLPRRYVRSETRSIYPDAKP